ncbi:MAG: phosphoadenosine phosphosulfate reductase family protein [bacterium]
MKQLSLITGQTKEEIAIDFIREYEPPEGWFGGFSGGKDSVVMKNLGDKADTKKPIQWYYSATGIDPPELVRFIREYHPEVKWLRPHMTRKRKFPDWPGTHSFFGMLQVAGLPLRLARWCCDDLKKNPSKNIPLMNRLMGLRAEESWMRAKRGEIHTYKNMTIYKPIFKWLTWEIWEYIESHSLPYCSLYDEGFDRLGCVICPFLCHGVKGDLLRHMNRWPKQYRAFEKAMKKLFDNYLCVVNPRSGGMNFRGETDFDTFLNNWYNGE